MNLVNLTPTGRDITEYWRLLALVKLPPIVEASAKDFFK